MCVCVRERDKDKRLRERERFQRVQYVQCKEESCVFAGFCWTDRKVSVFLTSLVNTQNFFILFYRTNKQRYLRQKRGSTDLVCLSPLKDINLDKRFTVLVTTWETLSAKSAG